MATSSRCSGETPTACVCGPRTAAWPTSSGGGSATVRPDRLLLGFGHALTINAAQGITSDEHINALPRGTSGVTAFTTYVAESRSRGATWTIISEAAVYETERHRQALGDITPITRDDLWARVADDMSRKPYKALGIDLLAAARRDREQAVDTFIACHHALETAQLDNPNFGRDAVKRLRALAINKTLSRHLAALDRAVAENGELIRDIVREQEADAHLRGTAGRGGRRQTTDRRRGGPRPKRTRPLAPLRERPYAAACYRATVIAVEPQLPAHALGFDPITKALRPSPGPHREERLGRRRRCGSAPSKTD